MKKNIFLTLITISVVSVFIFSCKKEKDEIKEQLIGSMKATVGTTAWEAQTPAGTIKNGMLVLTGIRLFGEVKESMALTLNALTAGTYDLNKNPLTPPVTTNTAIYLSNVDSTTSNLKYTYTAYTGSIIVSSVTENRASGTFSFKCTNTLKDTISVTAGEFKNILYISN